MRKFRIDCTFAFCDGETLIMSLECYETTLGNWKRACEERLNVLVDHQNGRRGSMTSFVIAEVDPQPKVNGTVTPNKGVL